MAARVLPTWMWLLALGGCRGCGCQPQLPDDPDDDTEDTATVDSADSAVLETADSGEPRCAWYEIEPNDAISSATPFGLQRLGCGTFDEPGDADSWVFTLSEPTALTCDGLWLGIRVDARHIGSPADASLTITSDGGEAAQVLDLPEDVDPSLAFPALDDTYTVILVEETGDGGKDFHYELMALQQKSPVCWDELELEGQNDSSEDPHPLDFREVEGTATPTYETSVFGWIDDTVDQDWFGFVIPEGKHTVTARVIAQAEGGAGDFKMTVETCEWNFSLGQCRDEPAVTGTYFLGEHGSEADPYFSVTSEGDERWSIRVAEQNDRSGQAYWYLLEVTVEE